MEAALTATLVTSTGFWTLARRWHW